MHTLRAKLDPFYIKVPFTNISANSYTLLKMINLVRESVATEVHVSFDIYHPYRTGVSKTTAHSYKVSPVNCSTRGTVLMSLSHSRLRPSILSCNPRVSFSCVRNASPLGSF